MLTHCHRKHRDGEKDEAESCYRGWGEEGSASLQPCEKQPRNSNYHSTGLVFALWRSNTSSHSQINVRLVSLPVLFHDVLKRPQKVFLESEVGEFPLLQKLHGQLPERVHCKDRHIFIGITANLQTRSSALLHCSIHFFTKQFHIKQCLPNFFQSCTV